MEILIGIKREASIYLGNNWNLYRTLVPADHMNPLNDRPDSPDPHNSTTWLPICLRFSVQPWLPSLMPTYCVHNTGVRHSGCAHLRHHPRASVKAACPGELRETWSHISALLRCQETESGYPLPQGRIQGSLDEAIWTPWWRVQGCANRVSSWRKLQDGSTIIFSSLLAVNNAARRPEYRCLLIYHFIVVFTELSGVSQLHEEVEEIR